MAGNDRATDLIVCDNLSKIYRIGRLEVAALHGLDLRVGAGEMIGIVGKSGSGKSTLLNLLGGHDVPTSGLIRVAGYDLHAIGAAKLAAYRRHVVGFVWQQTGRNLLPYLSAVQNVEQPLYYAGASRRAARSRAVELLEMVGLRDRIRHKPADLSGGEQQRVAIATALANSPRMLLADEPTGELDNQTAHDVLGVFKAIREQQGVTVVVVTHDPAVADIADRTVAIRDGRITEERVRVRHDEAGDARPDATHREYVVLDRTGRLQIPQTYLHTLGITDRAVIRMEDGRIVIEPAQAGGSPVRTEQ